MHQRNKNLKMLHYKRYTLLCKASRSNAAFMIKFFKYAVTKVSSILLLQDVNWEMETYSLSGILFNSNTFTVKKN